MTFHIFNKNAFFVVFTAILALTATVNAEGTRYKDRLFDVTKESDVTYASKVPALSSLHSIAKITFNFEDSLFFYTNENDVELKSMKMDIYSPKGDKEKKRAAVIVTHGGAMVAGSKSDYKQISITYCDSLAARGFVAASIDHRRGVTLTGPSNSLRIDSINFARAVYRGTQDINAAVRYMRKNADKYGIDPNRIYLVGNSSGAILSIENLYTSSEEDFPSYVNNGDVPDLGPLNLYGEQDVNFHANGGVLLWGATHNPKTINNSKVPVFLIHGTTDPTVPYKTGYPLQNAESIVKRNIPEEYAPIAKAISFKVEAPTLYGSYVIDSILNVNKVEHETYFVTGTSHELYDELQFEEPIRTKTFNFLYKLATSEPVLSIGKHIVTAQASKIQMQRGNLGFTISSGNNLSYTVIDLRGRIAKTGTVSANEVVDLSLLNNGVYVLRVQGERPFRFGLSK